MNKLFKDAKPVLNDRFTTYLMLIFGAIALVVLVILFKIFIKVESLSNYASEITLLFTAVVAISTVFYVVLTWRLANETEKMGSS